MRVPVLKSAPHRNSSTGPSGRMKTSRVDDPYIPFEHPSPRATVLAVYRQVLLARVQRQRQAVQHHATALGEALQPAALWREVLLHARHHPTRWLAAGTAGLVGWTVWRASLGRWAAPALGLWRLWRHLRRPRGVPR